VSGVAILSELQRRGVSVTSDGDALVLKPRSAVDSELLARVREHKPEIIRLISSHPRTCAPSCYEIEPGRWIHHPWEGCTTIKTGAIEPQARSSPTVHTPSFDERCKAQDAERGPRKCL
jgi:TubC N-terminal docking domain